jgi:hypothetical protein
MKDVRGPDSMYSGVMRTRTIVNRRAARPESPRPTDSADDLRSLDLRLDEALEETFPASDPVAVTPHPPKARGVSGR